MTTITGDATSDQIVVAVGKELIKDVIKTAWSKVAKVPEWVKQRYEKEDPFGLEAAKYCARVQERYGAMRIIGMARPMPIRNIFVRVNMLHKISAQRRSTIEDLEEQLNRDQSGFGQVANTLEGLQVVNREPRLVVLGKPGGGKTTFLKWIALSAIEGQFTERRMPVFIPMKDWSDGKETLLEYIRDEFKICGFEDPKAFVEGMLEAGSLILLFDALDEVNDNDRLVKAHKEIRDLASKYPQLRIVISCRTAAYNYLFEQFADVELADFHQGQVRQFVRNWFCDQPQKADLCLAELALDKNKAIRNLCQTPLLLTLMCLAFDEGMTFPNNRAELYKEALDALLKKWDASRSVRRNTAYQQLSLAKKELLLSRIAAKSFEHGSYFIRQSDIEQEIGVFMANLKVAPGTDAVDVDAAEVLKEIESQHGVLVERAQRIFSFSHLTFQEYFTARTITENTNQSGPADLVDRHATEPRWREVFVLTTGLLTEADDFVKRMRGRLSLIAQTSSEVRDFLNRNAALVHAAAAIPLPLRRALALAHVVDQLQLIEPTYGAVANACKELVEDMQKEFGRIKKIDVATIQTLKMGLDEARENVARVVEHVARYHRGDVKALNEYIQLTRLLVNCLNVDAYITTPTREQIISGILIEQMAATARA